MGEDILRAEPWPPHTRDGGPMKVKVTAETVITVADRGWMCVFCSNGPCVILNDTSIEPTLCVVTPSVDAMDWVLVEVIK